MRDSPSFICTEFIIKRKGRLHRSPLKFVILRIIKEEQRLLNKTQEPFIMPKVELRPTKHSGKIDITIPTLCLADSWFGG